jgi:hypothetical protein
MLKPRTDGSRISILKRVNVLLDLKAVTAQVRLANNVIKGSPGFSIFVPGDLHTINLEDFSAVCYTCPPQPASSLAGCRLDC